MSAAVVATASQLETALTPVVDLIMDEQGTGYRWRQADEVAAAITGVPTRFYRITESGRTYNLPKELNFPGGVVIIVVTPTDFAVGDVIERIVAYAPQRASMPNTIVIMTKENGLWRGEEVLQRAGTLATLDIDQHFPSVGAPVQFASL